MTTPTTAGQRFLETTTQTIGWFHGRLREDELVLKPLFQRNPVWTNAQKSYFIDSILRGFPVPELYLQMLIDGEGRDQHVVVDGQQRIRASLEFLEDGFSLNDGVEPWSGALFSDLSPELKGRLRQYKFSIRVLPALPEDLLREIFGRLNRNNMALNKQELRNATYWGRFITTMTDLSADEFWVVCRVFTANDFRRMLDIEYISELAVAVLYGPQNKKTSLDRYYEAFEEEFPAEDEVRITFARTISTIRDIVDWSAPGRWNKKSDFYTLFCYCASRTKDRALPQEQMAVLKEKLAQFGALVDMAMIDGHEYMEPVREYARYVQRAASDLQSRRVREAALAAFVEDHEYQRPSGPRGSSGNAVDRLVLTQEEEVEDLND